MTHQAEARQGYQALIHVVTYYWRGRLFDLAAAHRAMYRVPVAGVIHFWWLMKLDYTRPLVYSAVVGALLVSRLVFRDAPGAR